MLNWIKITVIVLSVVALCFSSMITLEASAQTCGCGVYGPSNGYYSYPSTPMNAPAESPVTQTPAGSPFTPALENRSASVPAQAAGYATVSGTVAYVNGTVVPGAIVQLQGESGAQYSGTTDANGHYEISNVKYDSYTFKYKRGLYESPSTTLDVNTASIQRDITLPALLEGNSAAAPAAIDNTDIQNWYATRYTPQKPSNKAVIYGQSGHIERVLTGIPCQSY
jgi:hypothetical protein